MEMLVEIIYDEIEKLELKAIESYKKILKKITDKNLQKVIEVIIDQEINHNHLFKKEQKIKIINEQNLLEVKKLLSEISPSSNEAHTIKEIIQKAIDDEENAQKCYLLLAESIEGIAKEELLIIANEEKQHSIMLKEIIKKL